MAVGLEEALGDKLTAGLISSPDPPLHLKAVEEFHRRASLAESSEPRSSSCCIRAFGTSERRRGSRDFSDLRWRLGNARVACEQ